VRIEPSIDLNATARVEDYDISSAAWHVDQDERQLPERSAVARGRRGALLALGRTENQQRLYTQQQQQQHANLTTDALLGGALNARFQPCAEAVRCRFGEVDPNYMGSWATSPRG